MYADVKSIDAAFEKAGRKITDLEGDMSLVRENLSSMSKQLKRFGQAFMSGEFQGRKYNRFWPSEEHAKEFGQAVLAIVRGQAKDLGTTSNEYGGALVPDELAAMLIDMIAKYGKFRRNTTVVRLGHGSSKIPKLTSDLTVYCPGEGNEITKSDLKVSLVGLVCRKFACLTVINRELDEDSVIGVGEIVAKSVVRSMAKKEDEIGFVGDGTSTYFGMMGVTQKLLEVDETVSNIAGLQVASGNLYSEITLDDFESLVGRLPAEADEDAKWFVSKKFFYNVMYKLARAAGVADLNTILSNEKKRYFMGYEVEFVHCMPSEEANSQICALLGDLSLSSYLGETRELMIDRSDEVLFMNDQICLRGTERIDIVVHGEGDTTNPGTIVGLITAAS